MTYGFIFSSFQPEHYDKMEKADILDLTVKYLSTVVSESAELSAAATSGRKFRAGYSECLKEVDQFLNTVAMETSAKSRLVGHLTSQAQAMTFQHMTDAAGERMVLDDVRRRETSAAHARGAPTAIVAPVHVAAPHTITRASSASAFRPEAHSAHDDAYLESRMKGDGRSKELVFPPTVSFTDTLPPLPAPLLFPHPGTMPHPEVLRPVPIDLRHKFCPPAVDRCVPVPVYDGRRPWDRPVSV